MICYFTLTTKTPDLVWVIGSFSYRDLSPKQIVPTLADKGKYIASESTIYRVLKNNNLQKHREPSKPRTSKPPPTLTASGPNQVLTWDITYLRSNVRGSFYYLYLFIDIYSRKIVGFRVENREDNVLAAELINEIHTKEGMGQHGVYLHSDNGSPMKGGTLLTKLKDLGISVSYSRPRVSNDNPFSESIFRTLKYRPEYPQHPFQSIEEARQWVDDFVVWYNTKHLHSGIKFVTPESRHQQKDREILAKRKEVYERARKRHPERWSRQVRNWNPVEEVILHGHRLEKETVKTA